MVISRRDLDSWQPKRSVRMYRSDLEQLVDACSSISDVRVFVDQYQITDSSDLRELTQPTFRTFEIGAFRNYDPQIRLSMRMPYYIDLAHNPDDNEIAGVEGKVRSIVEACQARGLGYRPTGWDLFMTTSVGLWMGINVLRTEDSLRRILYVATFLVLSAGASIMFGVLGPKEHQLVNASAEESRSWLARNRDQIVVGALFFLAGYWLGRS